jgi:hypothetical protein
MTMTSLRPSTVLPLATALVLAMLAPPLTADDDFGVVPGLFQLSRFGEGAGPSQAGDTWSLLDDAGTAGQSNALAFDGSDAGPRESLVMTCKLRVDEGGDGGAILFLDTERFGARGPAPYLPSWVEPNLAGTFAVGIDVHDPPSSEPFGPWGNTQGLPEREVSLHFDGRELVKRVADAEFRGVWVEVEVRVEHVVGGAEVSVRLGDAQVYDRHFVANLLPYEARLAFGAGTRPDVATRFDLAAISLAHGSPATPRRPPFHVEVFNHVLTDNGKTWFEAEVDLPPLNWAFGRVLLTLQIHDAGPDWDEWDRNGDVSLVDEDGTRWVIVPFITSYRTECHWVVDVTAFRPWLTGKRTLRIDAGTTFYKNRGYMMSVDLDFHHGSSRLGGEALEPFDVIPLWHGGAGYGSSEAPFGDFFVDQELILPAETRAARVFLTTTGHSQVGEFTPSERALVFEPGGDAEPARWSNTLWKSDCYLNPNRPQFGTWKYSRAGWAPGDVVAPWWVDLTPHLRPGAAATLRYEPSPYDFEGVENAPSEGDRAAASHVVRSYLIPYREPVDSVAAPIMRVTGVSGGSSAAEAGFQVGDYLARYDGRPVDSREQLGEAKAAALDAGKERVSVVVYRGNERLELEMATGQMGVNLSGP